MKSFSLSLIVLLLQGNGIDAFTSPRIQYAVQSKFNHGLAAKKGFSSTDDVAASDTKQRQATIDALQDWAKNAGIL